MLDYINHTEDMHYVGWALFEAETKVPRSQLGIQQSAS
jgi:hypothetical protein